MEPDARRLRRLYGGDEKSGRHRGRRATEAHLHGDLRARREREDRGVERPVRRNERAARRLLHDRRARPRLGALLGRTLPRRKPRHDRGPPDLGHVGPAMPRDEGDPASEAAEAVARRRYGKRVAFLAARTPDVAGAQDPFPPPFAPPPVHSPTCDLPTTPTPHPP